MLKLPTLLEPLFRAAGWQGPVKTRPGKQASSAHAIANRILDEFGGLKIGACGPGTEMAAGDVHFYERIRLGQSVVLQAWERTTGQAVAFASAHHDHMILFVGADGSFYVFTDPDEQLHAGPRDFGELMRCLLWGYPLGPTIPRDANAHH
jgi:hypothetical protein